MSLRKKLQHSKNLLVACRIRPIKTDVSILDVEDDYTTITITDHYQKTHIKKQQFSFQRIFQEQGRQEEVFNEVYDRCLNPMLDGVNTSMLAYGQTASGKSYTVFGDDKQYWSVLGKEPQIRMGPDKKDRRGLVPLSVEALLQKRLEWKEEKRLTIKCSFYEIYLMELRDLGRLYKCQFDADSDEDENAVYGQNQPRKLPLPILIPRTKGHETRAKKARHPGRRKRPRDDQQPHLA